VTIFLENIHMNYCGLIRDRGKPEKNLRKSHFKFYIYKRQRSLAWYVIVNSDISTLSLRGKDPHPASPPFDIRHPPPPTVVCFWCFLMFYNVNFGFTHVCTPHKIVLFRPNFRILEITLIVNHAELHNATIYSVVKLAAGCLNPLVIF